MITRYGSKSGESRQTSLRKKESSANQKRLASTLTQSVGARPVCQPVANALHVHIAGPAIAAASKSQNTLSRAGTRQNGNAAAGIKATIAEIDRISVLIIAVIITPAPSRVVAYFAKP